MALNKILIGSKTRKCCYPPIIQMTFLTWVLWKQICFHTWVAGFFCLCAWVVCLLTIIHFHQRKQDQFSLQDTIHFSYKWQYINIYLSKDLLCLQMTSTIKHLEKQSGGIFSKNENMFDK